jgi:hypothetical protein
MSDRGVVIAGSIIVFAVMLLVVLGVMAMAALLDPIR